MSQILNIGSADALKKLIVERDMRQVKVGVVDMDGVMAGKYMSRDKFFSSLDSGFGFCDVLFGWDVNNSLYDNTTLTGWKNGYADAMVRILPETTRELPLENNMLWVQGELMGRLEGICPRGVLRRVLKRAEDMGLFAVAGFEYEFLVADEDGESLLAKNYRPIKPLGRGYSGYSALRNTVNADFYRGLIDVCEQMGITLEGFHEESGPGALEVALCVDVALRAADKAATFKTFSKAVAQLQGRMLSFMAKWDESYPGQGGHIHISLQNADGKNLFYDAEGKGHMSDMQRHFIGGLQQFMSQIMCMAAPNVNSFRRLVPGYWAPTNATWGIDNRTVSLRVIEGSAKSQRVEYRLPGADANPYLALASALAAGLHGIEHHIEPDAPVIGNGYAQEVAPHRQLSRTLWEAAQQLKASEVARDWFGDDFVDHYAATREWEEREFQKHVTDWELKRYFEVI